jgi:hypothetical protein
MNQAQETAPLPVDVPQAAATNEVGTVEVENLDTFVKLLTRWHSRKVATLEHFLKLPDGQVVQIGDEPEFAVEGDVRKGFILGLNVALMEFGILPFSFEMEEAANDGTQTAMVPMPQAVDDLTPPLRGHADKS